MTSPAELVHYLDNLGITLWEEAGGLKFRAPAGALTPELAERLRREKPNLIAYLATQQVAEQPETVLASPVSLVRDMLAGLLQVDRSEIGEHDSLGDLGVDSVIGIALIQQLNQRLGLELQATVLFDTVTAANLADRLNSEMAFRHPEAAAPALAPAQDAICQGLLFSSPGNLEQIGFADLAIPAPSAGEVRVRVYASGLNFADLLCLRGLYPTLPDYPFIPGFEIAGVVDAVGAGVSRFRPGEPVFGVTGAALGGHAQFATVDQRLLVHTLPGWSFGEAAATPVAFLSAMVALYDLAELKPNQTVLIHAAAGGVGFAAVQLASLRQARIIGTSSSADKREWLQQAGISAVDYSDPGFGQTVLELTDGLGVDIVIDTLAGQVLRPSLELVAAGGCYVQLAVAGQRSTEPLPLNLFYANQSFHALDLRRRALAEPDWLADALSRLAKLLADASLRPVFSAVPAEQVNEALHALDQRATIGKLALTWPQPEDLAILPAPTTESPVELPTPPPLKQLTGTASDEPIAIIGMSAHLPGSPNLESLWQNLIEGRDLIGEIPANRWDWRAWYGSSEDGPRTQAKWGGFLSDIDAFDADFFGISRPEAELMDPRQRMFVEHVWTAIEHAGYDPAQLAGSDTGVFVGVGATDYFERLRPDQIEAHTTTGCFLSIMANRISYMFDLHGPSEPVDTACSSSLVAVHNAVNALRAGTCAMAIAGSTHLLLSPKIQLALSKSGMMSPDGRCKTFDSRADGYVRGEGVGALLLRPLAAAEAAGDPIHGLVLATAVNHGGRANSLTAPNPNAQADLLVEAYQKAGVDPETVTFIETHGTGTALGDPVEINALKRAFDKLYSTWDKTVAKTPHIALGAVKSNLGHLEISAGLAGIFKLLLSMKHHQRPANVHLQELNPLIDLRHTPFRILRNSEPWPQESFPHRAGVSSFGFGGVNAHIVLEEYRSPQAAVHPAGQRLIVLSAKTAEVLKTYAAQMANFLTQASDTDLTQLAWTLMSGRQPMKHRIAFAVDNCAEAVLILNRFAGGLQTSDPSPPREPALAAAAANFLAGKQVKWSKLYTGSPLPKRIALPTYPFQRDRFWLLADQPLPESDSPQGSAALGAAIDANISNFESVRFAKRWTLDSFVLADHIVAENPVLPGVAYLEMALAAADLANAQPITQLSDIIWARPMTYTGQPLECTITLVRDGQRLEARVLSPQGHVHAEMSLNSGAVAPITDLDLKAIGRRCFNHIEADAFYRRLATMNLNYQTAFQPVRKVSHHAGEVLGHLILPEPQAADFHRFRLHPSLIDGALQTVSCFLSDEQLQAGMTFLPFSLEAVRLIAPLAREVFVYARPSAHAGDSGVSVVEAPMDVSICDRTGKVLIALEGFTNKILDPTQGRKDKRENIAQVSVKRDSILAPEAAQIHCFAVGLRPEAPGSPLETGQLLVFDQDASTLQSHRTLLADAILVTPGPFYSQLDEHHYQVSEDEADLGLLFNDLERHDHWPQTICHLGFGLDAKRALLQLFLIGKTLASQNDDRPLRLLGVADGHISARADAAARFAFLRTLAQEAPNIAVRLLCAPNQAQNFAAALACELKTTWQGPAWIFHDQEGRNRQLLAPVPASLPGKPTALYRDGVALITGGTGGIGLLLAHFLGTRAGARIALIGRARYQDAVQGSHLATLKQAGVLAIYVEADVTRADEMAAAVARIEAELGPINSVFHCAGLNRDGLLFNKPQDDFEAVLAPKLDGTLVLDQVTARKPLDCFVMFSSIAGAMGNPGQADYAAANGFMDGFSAYRASLVQSGQRQGLTLSINWPLWLEGGMSLSKEHLAAITARTGLEPLETDAGMNALLLALAQTQSQLLTAPGQRDLIAAYLDQGAIVEATAVTMPERPSVAPVVTVPAATYLTGVFGQVLKKDAKNLELNAPFQDFGIDSFLTLKVIKHLEKDFGRLPKTLLFENHTIAELDIWLRKNHADTFAKLSPQASAAPANPPAAPASSEPIQKQATPAQKAPSPVAAAQAPAQSLALSHMPTLMQRLADVLKKTPQSLDPDQSFQDLGIDSFLTLKVIKNLEKDFGSLPKTLLFENHNLRQLSGWFDARYGKPSSASKPTAVAPAPASPAAPTLKPTVAPVAPTPVAQKPTPHPDLRTKVRASLAAILKKNPADIDADAAFQDYGIDSFLSLKLIKELEKEHGRLPKTLLFENHNLRQLGDWLQKHKAPAIAAPVPSEESAPAPAQVAPEIKDPEPPREANTYKRTLAILAQLLKREPETIASDQTFQSLGLDSLLSLKLIKLLEKEHGSLPKTLLFENHDLQHLVDWLERQGVHYQPIVPSQGVDHLDRVRQAVAYVLQRPEERLDNGLAFHEFGVDSFHTLKIIKHLEKEYGQLPKTLLFENHSIQQLATWLEGNFAQVSGIQAAQTETRSLALGVAGEPMIVAAEELPMVPELAAAIKAILEQYAREGSISRGTPEIAPFLFIDPERRCYFNFTLYSSVVLVYAYTGPDHLQEGLIDLALSWCRTYDFQLNFFEEKPFKKIGATPFTATPFGVMQRVHDVANFQLAGNKMRRLRYLVQKFEQLGTCRTEHYLPGSDSAKDQAIAVVIDAWCGQKTQINPLIYKVREELLAGQLGAQHRIYLTWLNESLCNAILITRLKQGQTWLMDLEFYGPEMPLGGLEYAIVNIIQHLATEGMQTYSLGGTYGPSHEDSPNEDPGVRALLDEMRDRDDFGKGNVQFKNKFRTSNNNIYLCRPEGADPGTVMDLLMMIADPVSMREQPPDLLSLRTLPGKPQSPEAALPRLQSREENVGDSAECATRKEHLSAAAYNVHRLTQDQVAFDLQTDSWAQLNHSGLQARMAHLAAASDPPFSAEHLLGSLLHKQHVVLTDSGRNAEALLMRHWQGPTGEVPQNLLFPSGLFHQIDQGFLPLELPIAQVFELNNAHPFKGELDLEQLKRHLDRDAETTAFVCIELCDNAAGGGAVSVAHLAAVKDLLSHYKLRLVLDATRILENAALVNRYEYGTETTELWPTVANLLSYVDIVVGSLAKDFCVNTGGFIASNDESLYKVLNAALAESDRDLAAKNKHLIARSLAEADTLCTQVLRRMAHTSQLHKLLHQQGVAVAQPGKAHCILIDPRLVPNAASLPLPGPALAAGLYHHTGIRIGQHSAGMQKGSSLNGILRLAVPVGLSDADLTAISARLEQFFGNMPDLPALIKAGQSSAVFGGEIDASLMLKP